MTPQSPLKTDLVIAMTLAETFLLLLFVTSYSVVQSAGDKPPEIWRALADECQQKLRQRESELSDRERAIATLEHKLTWWRDNFNVDAPQSVPELVAILGGPQGRAVLTDVGRGYPRCETENVLAQASVVRGTVSVQLLSQSPRLKAWSALSATPVPARGAVLRDWGSIRSFLSLVDNFYRSRQDGSRCRFDYRLTYETKEDYYDGRETFEHTFYPAGISRVPK
jgi:hypothetical protein